jgi:hypothetical protein
LVKYRNKERTIKNPPAIASGFQWRPGESNP